MTRIFIGIFLIVINLDVGLSGYFLPALGLMLIYTRLRSYGRFGRNFVMAGNFVKALMLCEVVILFVIATPLNLSDIMNSCIMIVSTTLQTCFYFYLMEGIQEQYRRRGDSAFRGSPVIGLAASRIMLIFFLITDFKLGAGICVLAILIFLVGVFRLLRQAGRDLGLDGMASVPSAVSSRMLWGGYILVIAIAVFGGMFFGGITTSGMAVHGDGSAALADQLIQRGMPEALAQDLSPEGAEALADVTSFTEIKGEGGKSTKVRLIAGMTGVDSYKLVLWYGDLGGSEGSKCLSREIIEVSRTEPITSCDGVVHYTKDDKVFSERIVASKVSLSEGKILIREPKEMETAETLYAELSLRYGADQVRGYLMLDGTFGAEGVSSSVYTELFDAKIIQFPYKNEKQTAVLHGGNSSHRSCTFVLPYRLQ